MRYGIHVVEFVLEYDDFERMTQLWRSFEQFVKSKSQRVELELTPIIPKFGGREHEFRKDVKFLEAIQVIPPIEREPLLMRAQVTELEHSSGFQPSSHDVLAVFLCPILIYFAAVVGHRTVRNTRKEKGSARPMLRVDKKMQSLTTSQEQIFEVVLEDCENQNQVKTLRLSFEL